MVFSQQTRRCRDDPLFHTTRKGPFISVLYFSLFLARGICLRMRITSHTSPISAHQLVLGGLFSTIYCIALAKSIVSRSGSKSSVLAAAHTTTWPHRYPFPGGATFVRAATGTDRLRLHLSDRNYFWPTARREPPQPVGVSRNQIRLG